MNTSTRRRPKVWPLILFILGAIVYFPELRHTVGLTLAHVLAAAVAVFLAVIVLCGVGKRRPPGR